MWWDTASEHGPLILRWAKGRFVSGETLSVMKCVSKAWPGWPSASLVQLWDLQQGHCVQSDQLCFPKPLFALHYVQGSILQGPLERVCGPPNWVLSSTPNQCHHHVPLVPRRGQVSCSTNAETALKTRQDFCHKEQQMVPDLAAHRLPSSCFDFQEFHLKNLHQFCHGGNTSFECWIYLTQRVYLEQSGTV